MIWGLLLWAVIEIIILVAMTRDTHCDIQEWLVWGIFPSILLLALMVVKYPSVLSTGNIIILWVIPAFISEAIPVLFYVIYKGITDQKKRKAQLAEAKRKEEEAEREKALIQKKQILTKAVNDFSNHYALNPSFFLKELCKGRHTAEYDSFIASYKDFMRRLEMSAQEYRESAKEMGLNLKVSFHVR